MSTMNEARFHDLVDALQQQVEDAFDDSDLCGRSLGEIREGGKADDSRRLQIRSQAARRQSLAGRLS